MMALAFFKEIFPFSGVKNAHDALVIAFHTFFIEEGYKCIGIGDEISDHIGDHSTQSLPHGWNTTEEDVYALQYKQSTSFDRKYLMKCLKIGTSLAVHVLDVAKGNSFDMTVDTNDFVRINTEDIKRRIYDGSNVIKDFTSLQQIFKTTILNEISGLKERTSSHEPTQTTSQQPPKQPSTRYQPDEDDPLRIPARRPQQPTPWVPSLPVNPFGFGDADRLPGHPGHGGMVMDPFHQNHRRPGSDFVPPGLPRGAVPPGARFDPFGPVAPDDIGRNPRHGRFSGPNPDHLRPPGFEDDMFM